MGTVAAKNSVFKLDKVGVLKDISDKLTAASIELLLEFEEDHGFGVNSKSKKVTLADGSGSLDYLFDSTVDKAFDVFKSEFIRLRNGTIDFLNFEYGPEGDTTGLERISGKLIITSFPIESDVNGLVTGSVGVEITQDVTLDTFP